MKEKLYCDRCSIIDKDCGTMILLNFIAFRYTNLKQSLRDDETGKSDGINKAIGRWTPLTLCDDCYVEFMDFKSRKSPHESSEGVADETPPTNNLYSRRDQRAL